jgi:hypothetical protein
MNQLSFKTVKNVWAKSLSVLDNPYVNLTLVIVLILYSSKMFGNINEVINGLYQYTFIKLLVLLIIAYVAPKDTNIAILLAISYVMSLKNMNMEKFVAGGFVKTDTNVNQQTTANKCQSVQYLQKALNIYITINSGLTDIIKSITNLEDPDLDKITKILTNLNIKFTEIIESLKTTITEQSNGQNCIIDTTPIEINSLQDTLENILTESTTKTNGKISCTNNTATTTAYDNIFLSLASIADNIKIYSISADKAQSLTVTCMAINNSITSIITNIETYLKGTSNSISDPNAVEIITALGTAKDGIDANIKFGTNLVQKYVSQILPTLCSILNDPTYKKLITNLPEVCKTKIASQLSMLIEPRFDKYSTFFTQEQIIAFTTSMNSNVLSEINERNILNPNAEWLKKCNANILTTTTITTTTPPSGDVNKSTTKNDVNKIYYTGITGVMTILKDNSINKTLNDFGKGLLIAHNKLFNKEEKEIRKTSKTIKKIYLYPKYKELNINKSIEEIKKLKDNNLTKAYAIGILVGNYYITYININKNKVTSIESYKNMTSEINILITQVINIVFEAVKDMTPQEQAEAIGFAVGLVALSYFNLTDPKFLNNRVNVDFIAYNVKTVIDDYFKNKNIIKNNLTNISKSAQEYVTGMIIANILISGGIKDVKDINKTIDALTSLPKAKNYSLAVYNAAFFKYLLFVGKDIWVNIFNSLMF